MGFLSKIKPAFWDHHDEMAAGPDGQQFSLRRKWKIIVMFTTAASLIPLLVMTAMDYGLSREAFESEAVMVTSRMVASTWHGVSFFLSEHRSVLEFVALDNTPEQLAAPGRLETILERLQSGIGGFEDIGLLNSEGNTTAYAGPYARNGASPVEEKNFRKVVEKGFFISDEQIDDQGERRLTVAVRRDLDDGDFFVLQSVLERDKLYEPVLRLGDETGEDAFIANSEGILQTPSRFFGQPNGKIPFQVHDNIQGTRIAELVDPLGRRMLAGYALIPESDFVLMIVRPKSGVMDLWFKPRLNLIWFLVFSILLIIASILWMATYLIERIHRADQNRGRALHEVEHANRLASIGRLAEGVAHEINNPLAIITQKVGLLKDLFTMRPEYGADEKVIGLVNDAMESIYRCGRVTRRLLDFSSHMESKVETVNLETVARQVLGFMQREAEKRCIGMFVDDRENLEKSIAVPQFACDRGALQQVLLILVNNAFEAMADGGRLDVAIGVEGDDRVFFSVSDTGAGIPEEKLKQIFEPFYTTSHREGASGLGLSIAYGLVREMGGEISVESLPGQGAKFTVTLPKKSPLENPDESVPDCKYHQEESK